MNNISKIIIGACSCFSLMLSTSGCIEETIPTSLILEEELSSSQKSSEALLWAMPACFNRIGVISSNYHWDWGYGSIMHIRDIMTEDFAIATSSYDHYTAWQQNVSQGSNSIYSQFFWYYYWKSLLAVNKMIAAVDTQTASDAQLGYLGAGYAFRAFFYLDLARMFEYLPTDKTNPVTDAGNDVTGYTVPIVKEGITEEQARKNPRVTREEMAAFILSDLNEAETYISELPYKEKTLPHLDVVYGLKARYYMWLGDYNNAKTYARKAIEAADVTPMTEQECLNTTTGFNDINMWMWGAQYVAEDSGVMTGGLLTWTSWSSNETYFGYAGAGPYVMIGASLYERLSDTDFRKKMFKAPKGSSLEGATEFVDPLYGNNLPDYASVKFRPGNGNMSDVTVGAVVGYPLMRVEEMYFIEAEAAAHINSSEGLNLLKEFMTTYRDPNYVSAATGDDLIEEIVYQKRIELWGEGQSFFDIKRLNMSVTRGYEGTNFGDATRFNTNGRPAWMNLTIVRLEEDNNPALKGWNNPDPSEAYSKWVEPGSEEE